MPREPRARLRASQSRLSDRRDVALCTWKAGVLLGCAADALREVTRTIAAEYRVQLSLFLRTRTDAVSKIERFIRDVHKAVLVDRYRDGNALNTRCVSDVVFYPTEDDEAYTTANVVLEIDYRTNFTDLNQPT